MLRSTVRRFWLVVLLALTACNTWPSAFLDKLTDLDSLAGVELRDVVFDHAQWKSQDPHMHEVVRSHEHEWEQGLREWFVDEAEDRGLLASGDAVPVPVDVVIVDLNPGSRALRFWVGHGYGNGWVRAIVTVRGHGSFGMFVWINGGWWGGDFVNAMERLGQAIADHLADRIEDG